MGALVAPGLCLRLRWWVALGGGPHLTLCIDTALRKQLLLLCQAAVVMTEQSALHLPVVHGEGD